MVVSLFVKLDERVCMGGRGREDFSLHGRFYSYFLPLWLAECLLPPNSVYNEDTYTIELFVDLPAQNR